MQLGADEAGMAAPRRLADDMTIRTQRSFRQLDHPWQIQVRQPEWITVEHAFVVIIDQPPIVPMKGLQPVDGRTHGNDLLAVQHRWQQGKALLLQVGQMVGGFTQHAASANVCWV